MQALANSVLLKIGGAQAQTLDAQVGLLADSILRMMDGGRQGETLDISTSRHLDISKADSLAALPTRQWLRNQPFMALRTNLLYDAALIPNIGLEVGIGKYWSIAVDWWYTWIPIDKRHFYWQSYGGYLSARYYFGRAAQVQRFAGHHVGLYGTMLTYDVEFGGKGYQAATFGFGGGVEYGYSLPVAPSLTIDFNLGLGYQGGQYKEYMPADDGSGHYVWMATKKRNWWGPTKAEISLKWLIGPMKEKGGRQ